MSRDSGSGDPSQRTVAELLAEHGGGAQRGARRRRRRAEDPTETAPQAIIDRVNSDSGRMRPVPAEDDGTSAAPPAGEVAAQTPSPPTPAAPPQPPPAQPAEPARRNGRTPEPPAEQPSLARRFTKGIPSSPPGAPASPGVPGAAEEPSNGASGGPESDSEVTLRQPAVAASSPAPQTEVPAETEQDVRPETTDEPAPAGTAGARRDTPVDGMTEQFPPVAPNGAIQPPKGAGEADGTALLEYPYEEEVTQAGAHGHDVDHADPYDPYDPYDDIHGAGLDATYVATDYRDDAYVGSATGDDGAVPDYDDEYGEPEDDHGGELPAGMDADDDLIGDADTEPAPARSRAREWLVLIAQTGGGLLGGGLVWLGFQWMWTALPIAALVAALVVTGSLVLVARRFLRTDDFQTILLSVVVGLVCTVSPAALLLVGY